MYQRPEDGGQRGHPLEKEVEGIVGMVTNEINRVFEGATVKDPHEALAIIITSKVLFRLILLYGAIITPAITLKIYDTLSNSRSMESITPILAAIAAISYISVGLYLHTHGGIRKSLERVYKEVPQDVDTMKKLLKDLEASGGISIDDREIEQYLGPISKLYLKYIQFRERNGRENPIEQIVNSRI